MKVKCINDDGWTGWLIMGKIYDVIEIDNKYCYTIIDDIGNEW